MGEALSGYHNVGYTVVCFGSKWIGLNLAWAGLILYRTCNVQQQVVLKVVFCHFCSYFLMLTVAGHPSIISRHYGTCRREGRELIKLPFFFQFLWSVF